MARIRSPNYPAMSLPEAIDRIGVIHQREQHLEAPREVMAKHLGYNSINGSSLKALSALLKYGLLEKTAGDRRRVTDLAVQILHPRDPTERSAAIREAAFRPALFAEIAKEWNGIPSDANLRAYLMRRNFARDAIPEVIDAYRKTIELVAAESGSYNQAPEPERKAPEMPASSVAQPQAQPRRDAAVMQRVITADDEPYQFWHSPGHLRGSFDITDEASADAVLHAVQTWVKAWKVLQRPAGSAKPPGAAIDAEDEEADAA